MTTLKQALAWLFAHSLTCHERVVVSYLSCKRLLTESPLLVDMSRNILTFFAFRLAAFENRSCSGSSPKLSDPILSPLNRVAGFTSFLKCLKTSLHFSILRAISECILYVAHLTFTYMGWIYQYYYHNYYIVSYKIKTDPVSDHCKTS